MQEHGRFVIYSPELGVYLGNFWGLGFWSKLDPAGQPAAATFVSEGEAGAQMATWDRPVIDATVVPVDAADPFHATIAECVAAGLPGWDVKVAPAGQTA